jgi:uncharacterized protein YifE (UPF0438 family)
MEGISNSVVMTDKSLHVEFIRKMGRFPIDCSTAIFSVEEKQILNEYGHWLRALESGELEPITQSQEHFVKVARFETDDLLNEYERVWVKYSRRRKIELESGDSLRATYQLPEDSFYSRDMYNAQRSTMYGVISQAHRKP